MLELKERLLVYQNEWGNWDFTKVGEPQSDGSCLVYNEQKPEMVTKVLTHFCEASQKELYQKQAQEILDRIVAAQGKTVYLEECEFCKLFPIYDDRQAVIGYDTVLRVRNLPYLVDEYPLDRTYDDEFVISFLKGVAIGLRNAVEIGMVYDNLSLEHLYLRSLDGEMKPVLGDYGRDVLLYGAEQSRQKTNVYSAPEVAANPSGTVRTMKTQLYAAGLMAYQMLNHGCLPFTDLNETPEQALTARRSGNAIPKPQSGSLALQAIVLKLCAYEPAERYADVMDLLQDLSNAVSGSAQGLDPSSVHTGKYTEAAASEPSQGAAAYVPPTYQGAGYDQQPTYPQQPAYPQQPVYIQQQTYGQPPYGSAEGMVPAAAPKKKGKGLLIGLLVAALVLVVGATACAIQYAVAEDEDETVIGSVIQLISGDEDDDDDSDDSSSDRKKLNREDSDASSEESSEDEESSLPEDSEESREEDSSEAEKKTTAAQVQKPKTTTVPLVQSNTITRAPITTTQTTTAAGEYQIQVGKYSWDDAETACKSKGGHLASIHSDADWNAIIELLNQTNATRSESEQIKYVWLGGKTKADLTKSENIEITFSWVDSSDVSFITDSKQLEKYWYYNEEFQQREPSGIDIAAYRNQGTVIEEPYLMLWYVDGKWSLNDNSNAIFNYSYYTDSNMAYIWQN